VQYAAAVRLVRGRGCRLFVEAGPGGVLAGLGARLLSGGERWLVSLRPGRDEGRQLLESLAELYAAGGRIDWAGLDRGRPHRRLALPTYPFQRRRFWWELPSATSRAPAAGPPGDEWLYELQWRHAERSGPAAGAAEQPGRWVLFADGDSLASRLAQLLEARGQTCITVLDGSGYQELGEGRFTVDPAQPGDWERLVSRILTSAEPPCRGFVHCWSLNTPPPEQTTQPMLEAVQAMNCGGLLHLVQALIKTGMTSLPRLWLVTRGGQPVAPGEDGLSPAQSPLWGLGRVLRFEHPEAWGGAIDLDPVRPADEADDVVREIWNPDGQDELAFRGGRRFVARLVRSPARGQPAPALPVRPDRTYLITGGLGSLGRKIAGWMIDHGAKHLVLTGRSAPSASACEDLAAWERKGAPVVVARADVAQREQLAAVLEDTGRSLPPLAGVIHAAGVLDDGVLLMQDWARFVKVMAPKVAGAWNVHSLTAGLELDFFVLFSSMASMLGSPGQGNYAAANCFLDVLAHYRRARRLPAVSINWGAWAEVGMAAELARRSPVQRTPEGVTAMPPDRGLAVLERLLTGAPPQVGVLPVDWKAFLSQFPDGAELPVLADVAREAGPREPSAASQPESELLKRLAAVPAGERLGLVVDHIRAAVATIMGLDVAHAPEPQQGFFEMGLDSLMAIELKNDLVASLGRSLPATVVFQHPTILDLAGYVLSDVLPAAGPEPTNGAAASPPGAVGLEDLSEDELLALLAEEVGILEGRVPV
jgi:acyl transferase domain-containing protein